MRLTRREFNRLSAMAGISCLGAIPDGVAARNSLVSIVKTSDRYSGISKAVSLLGGFDVQNRDVYLKGSYNSSNPFPASTHPDALHAIIQLLMQQGAHSVTLVERSGMGDTRQIMEQLGALQSMQKLGAAFLPLEELAAEDWSHAPLLGSHWRQGVEVPGFLLKEPCIVQICNLNTHRFGGQFSASLKNSIGLVAKYGKKDSHNYMKELHESPDQCQLIAEINQLYQPSMVIMDASRSFIVGGPESGETAAPGVILASRDRVAVDAAGLAILQYSGADLPPAGKTIFDHPQIKRAAELELGAGSADDLLLVADDKNSRALADILENLLRRTNE